MSCGASLIRRPGIRKERGTHVGAKRRIPPLASMAPRTAAGAGVVELMKYPSAESDRGSESKGAYIGRDCDRQGESAYTTAVFRKRAAGTTFRYNNRGRFANSRTSADR